MNKGPSSCQLFANTAIIDSYFINFKLLQAARHERNVLGSVYKEQSQVKKMFVLQHARRNLSMIRSFSSEQYFFVGTCCSRASCSWD